MSKGTAAVLALLFGGLGVQYFYCGHTGRGLMCLIFCWTFIPAVWGFVSCIVLASMSDETFQRYCS